jgi:serpin B
MPPRREAHHAGTSWETIVMRTVRSFIAAPAAGLWALMLISASAAFPAVAQAAVGGETRDLAESMNKLGGALLGSLAGSRNGDTVVISPYGLGSALHLLSFGAGDRAQQTLRAKLLPPGFTEVRHVEGLIALKRHILGASRDKLKLTVASAVFIPEGAKPWSQFVGTALGVFDAIPEALNFRDKAAVARINAWANRASQGLIPRIVEQLDADARFVLANVVYFNGAWETAFEAERTAKAPFTRVDGSKRDVAMMDATIPVEFAEFDDLRAVWLPYDGKDVAMFLVAPGERQGPTAVAEALKRKSLGGLMADAQKNQRMAALQVRLPRFRVESKLDVTGALYGLGLGAAFAPRANYNAINKAGGGLLQVTHRAVLEVTESGTKAAAATAITSDRSMAAKPSFSADRPFAVAIVHRPTGAILFAGYIADPGDDPGPAPAEPKAVR